MVFVQAEDGIRDLVRSRGLGDVYKRQVVFVGADAIGVAFDFEFEAGVSGDDASDLGQLFACLLYTSDAADERSSVDLGGRRIIKKNKRYMSGHQCRL